MVSLFVAYLLWSIGGLFGLHHLYLGRPYHAFVWLSTLGGVFGLGWMRELWRLPEYVRSSNADKDYRWQKLNLIALKPKPSCGYLRFVGMFVMGALLSAVLSCLLPNHNEDVPVSAIFKTCHIVLILVGSSLGVFIVANVGELQCSWKYPVVGALLSIPWLLGTPINYSMATFLSMMVTWWKGLCWRPVGPLNKNRKLKVGLFLLGAALWTSVLGYGLYYNTSITVNGEDRIPLRVVIGNFLASPAWQRTKESFYRLYRAFMTEGWDHAYYDASDIFDFSGEMSALSLLGLKRDATPEETTRKCRKMSALTHPDRFKTEKEKEKAQTRFIEIQDACTLLSTYKGKRSSSRQDPDDE